MTILDVGEKYVLFSKTNLLKPSHLVIGKFDPKSKDIGNMSLKIITNPLDVSGSSNFKYEHNEVVYDDDQPISEYLMFNYYENFIFISWPFFEIDSATCTYKYFIFERFCKINNTLKN